MGRHIVSRADLKGSITYANDIRQQSATGNDIAGKVAGIDHTSSIAEVSHKAEQMRDSTSRLRELISYFRFIR